MSISIFHAWSALPSVFPSASRPELLGTGTASRFDDVDRRVRRS